MTCPTCGEVEGTDHGETAASRSLCMQKGYRREKTRADALQKRVEELEADAAYDLDARRALADVAATAQNAAKKAEVKAAAYLVIANNRSAELERLRRIIAEQGR